MQCLSQLQKNKRTCQKSETLFKHFEKRSYLSGRRVNITLIFMSSSSYLVHAISCRRISFFFFGFPFLFLFIYLFYFLRPDPPPATRLPVTRHPSPAEKSCRFQQGQAGMLQQEGMKDPILSDRILT